MTRTDGEGSMAKEKSEKLTARKKGEEGYWERKTSAGTEASAAKTRIFTEETFTKAANAYFDDCDSRDELYGEAGLCLFLSKWVGRPITLERLRDWYDGDKNQSIQDAVHLAYMRIQHQVETDPRYQEKAMVSRGIFLQKQMRFGSYQDRQQIQQDTKVEISFGESMDQSDFR